jgi:alpha-amylase
LQDTGSTQAHWPFPRMKKLEGYAYIMSHPGIPTVFLEHLEVRAACCALAASCCLMVSAGPCSGRCCIASCTHVCCFAMQESDGLKSRVVDMISMRKRMGIHSASPVKVLSAEPEQYVAETTGRNGAVRVKLGPKRDMGVHKPDEAAGWKQIGKGKDYALWERAST